MSLQSIGRGIRNAKLTAIKPRELTVFTSGLRVGKTMITFDFESDTFTDWDHVMCPHWVEKCDYQNNKETSKWYRYNRKPHMAVVYEARRIIRQNENGTFELIKNRTDGTLGLLSEEDEKNLLLVMIAAEHV